MPIDLWLDQDQVYEEDHKIMLDVFVGKAPASRALCKSDAFAERPVVGFAVACIKLVHWKAALNADWHHIFDWQDEQLRQLKVSAKEVSFEAMLVRAHY